MALTPTLEAYIAGAYTKSGSTKSAGYTLNSRKKKTFASGTLTGQVDIAYDPDTLTIAASGTLDVDLAGGGITNQFGQALTFVKVKAIWIAAALGNTNNVVVGGAPSNGFLGPFGDATDKISIPPDGVFCVHHPGLGWTVTAGTGDLFHIANSGAGTGVSFDLTILGTSA